jgi:hypothetical protein
MDRVFTAINRAALPKRGNDQVSKSARLFDKTVGGDGRNSDRFTTIGRACSRNFRSRFARWRSEFPIQAVGFYIGRLSWRPRQSHLRIHQ